MTACFVLYVFILKFCERDTCNLKLKSELGPDIYAGSAFDTVTTAAAVTSACNKRALVVVNPLPSSRRIGRVIQNHPLQIDLLS